LFDAVAVVLAAESTDQIAGIIDERQRIFDIVLLGSFSEKLSYDRDRICRIQP